MTGEEYREAIGKLGLSQVAAGKFFETTERASRRWIVNGPPPVVAMILTLMIRGGLSVADVMRITERDPAILASKRGRPAREGIPL